MTKTGYNPTSPKGYAHTVPLRDIDGNIQRSLLHRFWVHFDGSYTELIKAFEEAFDPRWYFLDKAENITPDDHINFGDCEISVKKLTNSDKPIDNFPGFSWHGNPQPVKKPNFTIDFLSFVTLDTPKTRKQLREVARSIPGSDAILTWNNQHVVGSRMNDHWSFSDYDGVPDLAIPSSSKPYPDESQRKQLNYLVSQFTYKHRSMFDPYLQMPFNKDAGLPFTRFDWKIHTTKTIEEISLEIVNIAEEQEPDIYWEYFSDFDDEYTTCRLILDNNISEFYVQSSSKFVVPNYDIFEIDTLLLSYLVDAEIGSPQFHEERISRLVKMIDPKAQLYIDLLESENSFRIGSKNGR